MRVHPAAANPGLAQLTDEDAVRDVDNLDVRTDGSAVVPLPALAALSGEQLVALEGTLKFEERDARDDALKRPASIARKLAAQLKRVRTRPRACLRRWSRRWPRTSATWPRRGRQWVRRNMP